MNHAGEGLSHEAKHRCRYTLQYDNRVYTCKVSWGVCLRPALFHVGRELTSLCSTFFRPAMREERRS